MSSYRQQPGFSLGGSLSTVVRLLIAWNVIFFLVQILAGRFLRGLDIGSTFGLVPAEVLHGKVWQLVTYMFLHGSLLHIAFNMLALFMFGSELEYLWGSRRFVQYYLFTGIGAGITNTLFEPGSMTPVVGASGAIYGLLLAYGMYFPNRTVLAFFFLPMPAKYFVIVYGAMEFFYLIRPSGGGGIAHIAHLGGLLFGLIYLKVIPWGWFKRRRRQKGKVIDIRDFYDRDDRDHRWR